jgi:hypothetical protein
VQRGIKQNKTMTVTSKSNVLVQVSVLDEVKNIRRRLINAIIEERFEFVGVDKSSITIKIEGFKMTYHFNDDHFMKGHIMGVLYWFVEPLEQELIEHSLRNHIPKTTTCTCCGQNCTKS